MIRKRFQMLVLSAALASTIISGCANTNDTARQQPPPSTSRQQVKSQVKTKTSVKTMKIRLKLDNITLDGTLEGNATVGDFVALLPLSLTLTDYAQTEKISDLPKKLSTEGENTAQFYYLPKPKRDKEWFATSVRSGGSNHISLKPLTFLLLHDEDGMPEVSTAAVRRVA